MSNCKTKKLYSEIQNLLKGSKLSKTKIRNTEIFKCLIEMGFQCKENILISNITSMCDEKDPHKIRIRSDKFLKKIGSGEKHLALISGVHINNVDLLLVFFGKSFYGYNSKTDCSNSFITFNFEDLKKFSLLKNDIQYKNIKIGNGNKKTKYMFFVSSTENFNKNDLIKFYEQINEINFNPYKDEAFDQKINEKTKQHVMNLYEKICAIAYCDRNECKGSERMNYNNLVELAKKTTHCLELQVHHFIPKKWFKEQPGIVDWDIVNNSLNLIPICLFCHNAIHHGNEDEINQVFDNILNSFKKVCIYDDFVQYAANYAKLDVKQIRNIYIKKGDLGWKKL